tara:strand:+ start:1494 stop:3590 length:2097 start_codon:yes stop_codon:yes gene_type:complete
MSLDTLDFKSIYNFSRGDNILKEFYIPCLKNSVQYDRTSGYFTSASLVAAASGMATFIKNGGKYRLIFGKEIPNKNDYQAIKDGYSDNYINDFVDVIDNVEEYILNDAKSILGWLIKNGYLDIKIAFRDPDIDTYHAKWGNFTDKEGNRLHFLGSLNETYAGWTRKPEHTYVFGDWKGESDYNAVDDMFVHFEKLWNNKYKDIETIHFPDVLKEKLVFSSREVRSQNDFEDKSLELDKNLVKIIESNRKELNTPRPRDYQKAAVDAWIDNDYSGIFAHATGLGKTYSAIFSIIELAKVIDNKYLTVLAAPTKDLLDQWENNFNIDFENENFSVLNFNSIKSGKWRDRLSESCLDLENGIIDNKILLVTYKTFCNTDFINIIEDCNISKILIADEAHNVGSKSHSKGLIDSYKYRLALTATPKRHFDDFGTNLITNYFGGDPVSEYDLEWAIKEEHLCPYYYHIKECTLNSEEQDLYHKKTVEMMKFFDKNKKTQSIQFQMKALDRSNIIKNANNKIHVFNELLNEIEDKIENSFIFCPKKDFSNEIANVLTQRNKLIKFREFDSTINMKNRQDTLKILSDIEEGYLDTVVAINCLDEGIDIPSTKTAFLLSSSSNPKQFIQRRGRVLRNAPNKEHAVIYDFLCFPSIEKESAIYSMEKSLIKNQLRRLEEFSNLSLNSNENNDFINQICNKWEIKLDE